jgi:acetyl-CoA carboxylase biotin carboxylase subunit
MAQQEALQAFGSGDLYLEKLIAKGRHIEVQVLMDDDGNVLQLGERECSVQRRNQKILEESPSALITSNRRRQIGDLVARVLQHVGYRNAGTVEFLVDEWGELYFMEINTRIQVEHPVTEMVTGLDLVKSQILLAAGASVSDIAGEDVVPMHGHSMECRINAENSETFIPSPGRIRGFHMPGGPGVRVDSACYTGSVVHPHYDSLIAKLIVHGRDRAEAIDRMRRALRTFIIDGIDTLIPLHEKILSDPDFLEGRYDVRFLHRFRPTLTPGLNVDDLCCVGT